MKKKLFALVMCVAMLSVAVIGGTMAYFTDTDAKTNTFTMGKVDITLEEPSYETSEDDGSLKVFPGQTYDKDPTITVAEDSENCWLVATVTISSRDQLEALYEKYDSDVVKSWGLSLAGEGALVSGGLASLPAVGASENNTSGTLLGDKVFLTYTEEGNNIIYTFFFKEVHEAGDVEVLFEKVNIPAFINNGDIEGNLTIDVNAFAIQEIGFNNVYDAYAAFVAQEVGEE